MMTWRLEIKFRSQLVEKIIARLLPDSHRAIALHVAMAAHRAQTCARLAELSAQHHEIDDLLNVRDGVLVLGQAHRPAEDHALRVNEDAPCVFDFDFRDARLFEDVAPVLLADVERDGGEREDVGADGLGGLIGGLLGGGQSGNSMGDIASSVLDRDHDGSSLDDIASMAFNYVTGK